MRLSNELTLYCPSYERPEMLERTLRFYSEYEYKVIVVDGSRQPLVSGILDSHNINYFHKPISTLERIDFAMSLVETPYVSLVPDDDFMLPSANRACVDYLNNMDDYVACSGRAMFYEEHPKGVIYREAFPGYRDKDFYQRSATDRLKLCFKNYDVFHMWSVIRTSAVIKSQALVYGKTAMGLQLAEPTFEFAIAAQGKSKVLNCLRWMRSRCPQVDWREGVPDSNSFYKLQNEQRETAIKSLASMLLRQMPEELSGMNSSDICEIFNLHNDDAGRKKWFSESESGFRASIPASLKIKQGLKKIVDYLSCPDEIKRNNAREFAQMRAQLVKVNDAELDHIRLLLAKYPISYEVQ